VLNARTELKSDKFSVLEHGSEEHRSLTLDHLIAGLLDFAINEQGFKSLTKALKEGGKDVLDRVVKRMCEPARGYVNSNTRYNLYN
jgi:hypothetical protein